MEPNSSFDFRGVAREGLDTIMEEKTCIKLLENITCVFRRDMSSTNKYALSAGLCEPEGHTRQFFKAKQI